MQQIIFHTFTPRFDCFRLEKLDIETVQSNLFTICGRLP